MMCLQWQVQQSAAAYIFVGVFRLQSLWTPCGGGRSAGKCNMKDGDSDG